MPMKPNEGVQGNPNTFKNQMILKFSIKAIYLYLREITGLNTKQVVNNPINYVLSIRLFVMTGMMVK